MQPKVWIAKDTGHDLSGAERYGEVCAVFDRAFSPFKLREARAIIRAAFKKTPPKPEDYVLFMGPTSLNVQLVVDLMRVVGGGIRCLIYHAKERAYMVRDIGEAWERESA